MKENDYESEGRRFESCRACPQKSCKSRETKALGGVAGGFWQQLGNWEEVEVGRGCTVLTPNEHAAATLGASPLSLEALALQVLGEERIAHPVLNRAEIDAWLT